MDKWVINYIHSCNHDFNPLLPSLQNRVRMTKFLFKNKKGSSKYFLWALRCANGSVRQEHILGYFSKIDGKRIQALEVWHASQESLISRISQSLRGTVMHGKKVPVILASIISHLIFLVWTFTGNTILHVNNSIQIPFWYVYIGTLYPLPWHPHTLSLTMTPPQFIPITMTPPHFIPYIPWHPLTLCVCALENITVGRFLFNWESTTNFWQLGSWWSLLPTHF